MQAANEATDKVNTKLSDAIAKVRASSKVRHGALDIPGSLTMLPAPYCCLGLAAACVSLPPSPCCHLRLAAACCALFVSGH